SAQHFTGGSYSAEVNGTTRDSTLTLINPISLSEKASATLTYSWCIWRGLDLGEYLALDVSADNGVTWQELARLDGNIDQEDVWHDEKIDLGSEYMVNGFKIRFRAKMSWRNEYASIDEMKVVSTI
ncbi:hypothetical protein ACFLWG_01545, partial [Chloroflexota bacterium]